MLHTWKDALKRNDLVSWSRFRAKARMAGPWKGFFRLRVMVLLTASLRPSVPSDSVMSFSPMWTTCNNNHRWLSTSARSECPQQEQALHACTWRSVTAHRGRAVEESDIAWLLNAGASRELDTDACKLLPQRSTQARRHCSQIPGPDKSWLGWRPFSVLAVSCMRVCKKVSVKLCLPQGPWQGAGCARRPDEPG